MLKFELNVEERKTLAKRMEELTGIHPYYTKAPRYAYDIGNYTIDRDGSLLVEAENADLELLTTLMNEYRSAAARMWMQKPCRKLQTNSLR